MNRFLLTALTSAALLVPAANALAAPGDLDTTFSGDGRATADLGGLDRGSGAVVQPDGKLVALGQRDIEGETDFQVVRFNRDGTPDPTFGGDGQAGVRFGPVEFNVRSHPTAIALQPDGKIVVVGDTDARSTANNPHDMAVARLNLDGSPDKSFNGNGRQIFDVNKQQDGATDVAVQADGRIIVAGTAVIGNDQDFVVARLTDDGQLDPTWSDDGLASSHFGADERLNGITIAPDGEVVAAGQFQNVSTETDTAIARYTTAGRPESAFSGDGKQVISLGSKDSAVDIAAQPDGKLVLAGADITFKRLDTFVARVTGAGELDTTFGTGGKTAAPVEAKSFAAAVAVTDSGSIVLAGSIATGPDSTTMMAFKTDSDGRAATTFGRGGVAQVDSSVSQNADDLALDGNRAFIVGEADRDLGVSALTLDAVAPPQELPPAPAGPAPEPQTPQGAPQPAADGAAPIVSKLKLKASRGTEKGAFRLSEPATVKVSVQRKVKRGKRTRLVAARTVTLKGKAGANSFTLKKLKPGSYRVTLKATDGAGNAAKPLRKSFVLKQKRR